MAIDKTTNKLSTLDANGETAANRYRTTFNEADNSVADALTVAPAAPSGQRTDFTGTPLKHLVDEMYQNVADGYRGRMSVPGGATVTVSEITNDKELAFMPDRAKRRTNTGQYVEVRGAWLLLPGSGHGKVTDTLEDTVADGKRMIKTVVARALKAKTEKDARLTFRALQDSAVDLGVWVPGADADADSLIESELGAARLGFRGQDFGPVTTLNTWVPGADAAQDAAVRHEVRGYRAWWEFPGQYNNPQG